jgi:hypothetical protein
MLSFLGLAIGIGLGFVIWYINIYKTVCMKNLKY